MYKKIVSCIFALFVAMAAYAQSTMNPSDSVYSDIRAWQTQGLLGLLPQLRPYPVQVVKDILNKVMSEGTEQQVKRAKYQYNRLFGKRLAVGVKTEAAAKSSTDGFDKQAVGALFAAGQIEPLDLTSIVFDFSILATNKDKENVIHPAYSAGQYDIVSDPMSITSSIRGYFEGNAEIGYGTSDAYVLAGLNRSSWGDFYDNGIVLTPDAFHAGNITASINREKWNYSLSMFSLAASKNDGSSFYPEKFLALHSITFQPVKPLDITFFETVVYGQRIEPMYLIPVVPMMLSQGVAGFIGDNLMMGLAVKVRPMQGLNWNTSVMIDDVNLNELVKRDLDTQIKFAGQTGFVWIPDNDLISSVTVDYTAVMPYMYTHSSTNSQNDEINYQNYTNNGINLGSQLQPNSDCVSIKTTLRPTDSITLSIGGAFIRHANVNESLPEEIASKYITGDFNTDGSVYNYADNDSGCFDWAKQHFLFMCQDTKEYTIRGSLDATWELPQEAWGRLSLNAGYVCEYINNHGVDNDIYTNGSGSTASAKAAWKANLKDILNNYFTIGVKYAW